MSTRLTIGDLPMVESHSLKLAFGVAGVQEGISEYLSSSLKRKGYESASSSVLNFLGALECGVNFGSEIARNLGVSRQMVAKTVKELCRVGYLDQKEGEGKQKQIVFTLLGEQLMSDSRLLLAELDGILVNTVGEKGLVELIGNLEKILSLIT